MLEGKCKKCGAHYYGWALKLPRNQSCPKCGVALELYEEGMYISEGYSPFTADEYVIKAKAQQPPSKVKKASDKPEDVAKPEQG